MHFRAIRDIPAGQELTLGYTQYGSPVSERQENLFSTYGLRCGYPACVAGDTWDNQRERVEKSSAWLQDVTLLPLWSLQPVGGVSELQQHCLRHIEMSRTLGVDEQLLPAIYTLLQISICLANTADTLKYGTLLYRFLLTFLGQAEGRTDLLDMEFSRSLPTWGLRTRDQAGRSFTNTPIPFMGPSWTVGVLYLGTTFDGLVASMKEVLEHRRREGCEPSVEDHPIEDSREKGPSAGLELNAVLAQLKNLKNKKTKRVLKKMFHRLFDSGSLFTRKTVDPTVVEGMRILDRVPAMWSSLPRSLISPPNIAFEPVISLNDASSIDVPV